MSLMAQVNRASKTLVPNGRPFDNGGNHDQSKTIEYARWLAKRDGIELKGITGKVEFFLVHLDAYKRPIHRAYSVKFGKIEILIPHFNYDPTLPAKQLDLN